MQSFTKTSQSCLRYNPIRKRCCTPYLAKLSKRGKPASQHRGQLPGGRGVGGEAAARPECYSVRCSTVLLPLC